MAQEMVGIREAVRSWHVSERALRRRLTAGENDDAQRAEDGSWLIPREWLDEHFDRSVIDLRDPAVSDGLAAVLAEITSMTSKVTNAEVRAAVAEADRDSIAVRLRTTTDDLEAEETERQRLDHDYRELQKSHAVQTERLQRAEVEIERAWTAWEHAEAEATENLTTAQSEINRLSRQVGRTSQKLRVLETMTSRRKQKTYQTLADQIDRGN